MLKKSYHSLPKKILDVPNLCSSSQKEAIVEVRDPLAKDKIISRHVDLIPERKELTPVDFVHDDDAELYSIKNLMDAGIQPTFAPTSYIKAGLDSALDADNQCADLLDRLESQESSHQESSQQESSQQESSKTE